MDNQYGEAWRNESYCWASDGSKASGRRRTGTACQRIMALSTESVKSWEEKYVKRGLNVCADAPANRVQVKT